MSEQSKTTGEHAVYVMRESSFSSGDDDGVDLRRLWGTLRRHKLVIIVLTLFSAAGSLAYALLAEEWYRAEVLLAPAQKESMSPLNGPLGGLAALAGVSVDAGDSVEAVATLKSREFARAFIEDNGLLTTFFADDWDAVNERWSGNDPEDWPDVRDAIAYFHERVLTVTVDQQTSLVALAVEWKDANAAADWANELVRRLNAELRGQALREAEANVKYLKSESVNTTIVTLQQSIGRLLETELERLMLARGNEEFAFQIIDSAEVPKYRVRPQRALIIIIGTLLGVVAGAFVVVLRSSLRSSGPDSQE